ncbi:family 78 glycoside hydrolase catalytic domain [Coraliomargarita sp. SDUM461004]|uniref:Family 78 glycoside hydrolase catalytic domain n=1 Tax=Thalassobacterium sedimentorum TaxID=3041258 RepID=A0ABU1AGH7_9BACT|nr:alpha-L-rhamnosidase C-terminal domain-containing protein [Coraliomargarita sp. SDUM461004]MDQ8192940.1 family 78 glycoside hydrolase catalytic domain [Coraliomargarita sp. SDUM461004]
MTATQPPAVPSILKKAQWIWPESPSWNLHNCYALFRKSFDLKSLPEKAPLHITADQSYQLYINGHYICRGPARGFQRTWPYDTVDIAKWLVPGVNLIAVRAHNPGFGNFQYVHQGYAGLLVAAQWEQTELLSNNTWKGRRQTGIRKDTVPTSLQLFSQEVIDLRIESPDWMLPNFNDSQWNGLISEVPWNSMPWYSLQARGIPMLDEGILKIGKVIGQAKGKSTANYQSTCNLSHNKLEEGLSHTPHSADATELPFAKCSDGEWRSQLIDLGKLHVGCVCLEIVGPTGGEIVETHHYETLDQATLCPDYNPDAHSLMAFSQRLICRKGKNHHSFYHPFGFRYMIVTVRDNKTPLTIKSSLRKSLYPVVRKGAFECSESLLKDIWETCAWTEEVCSMDAYVDTPWREQAQWWGDARVQAWNTFHLSGDHRLFKRGIQQIAAQVTPDGVTYGHAPTIAHGCILPDFTLIWMLTLWDFYWQTGSLEPFQQQHTVIQKALEYFERQTNAQTGLLNYDHRFWLFLDWTDIHKHGCSSVYSLWYLHTLDRLNEMYSLCGDTVFAENCQRKAINLRKNLHKLINAEGLIQDGYTEQGHVVTETSVHAQTLALLTRLTPENEDKILNLRILPYIRSELKTDIQPSAYWITYIYTALSERGYGNEVIADIRKRWAPMVTHGTTWENFAPKIADESFSHAWSAHPLYHLMQILGGIRQSSPGWENIKITPTFTGDAAAVVIPSPLGNIHSAWSRNGDYIKGSIQLPEGMEATLQLPSQQASTIRGDFSYSLHT